MAVCSRSSCQRVVPSPAVDSGDKRFSLAFALHHHRLADDQWRRGHADVVTQTGKILRQSTVPKQVSVHVERDQIVRREESENVLAIAHRRRGGDWPFAGESACGRLPKTAAPTTGVRRPRRTPSTCNRSCRTPLDAVTMILPPTTIGLDVPCPGRSTFQAMLNPLPAAGESAGASAASTRTVAIGTAELGPIGHGPSLDRAAVVPRKTPQSSTNLRAVPLRCPRNGVSVDCRFDAVASFTGSSPSSVELRR